MLAEVNRELVGDAMLLKKIAKNFSNKVTMIKMVSTQME
jgi:hypothetical protein